jgi:hypothetical protein
MKIEQQTPAQSSEYNQEVQVEMTLSELKTILTLIGSISPKKIDGIIDCSKSQESLQYLQDDNVESRINLIDAYHSMKDKYLAIPKKPKFRPITFTIESEEELIALRIATGKISGSVISMALDDLGVRRKHDEVDQICNANYAMFGVFAKIFEGQVK